MAEKTPFGLYRFSDLQLDAYLTRIGCDGARAVSARSLERLHFNHIQNIVFENLDIHLGRPIEIDVPKTFDKIIRRGRGGFCYELNAVFASLLYSLGYDVTVHAARVVTSGSRWIPFGHVCLKVVCEGDWLVDVGFGNSFQRPLKIDSDDPQVDEGGAHRLEPVDEGWLLSSKIDTEDFDPEYRFDLTPRHLDEFKERCHWTQTSTDSGFTHRTFVTRPVKAGRLTVLGLELRTFKNGTFKERMITRQERDQIFTGQFGLPAEDVAQLPEGDRATWFKIDEESKAN